MDLIETAWPREELGSCSTDIFPSSSCLDRPPNHSIPLDLLAINMSTALLPCKPSPCKPVGRQSGIFRVGECFVFGYRLNAFAFDRRMVKKLQPRC